jgi:hypothetical protein
MYRFIIYSHHPYFTKEAPIMLTDVDEDFDIPQMPHVSMI